MQEKAKLVKEGFQEFHFIDRNLRPSITEESSRLSQITTGHHLVYQELQAMNLTKKNRTLSDSSSFSCLQNSTRTGKYYYDCQRG